MAGNITASDVWAAISEGKRIALPNTFSMETLSGDLTLDESYGNIISLDPGGAARDVTLPAAELGAIYLIVNTADDAETITVKRPAGTTVVSCAQNRAVLISGSATDWVEAATFVTA